MTLRALKWTAALLAMFCGIPPAHAIASERELSGEIERLIVEALPKGAELGVLVVDAGSGDVVYERDADKLLMVASNNKLFVTACALDRLGKDFKFETSFYRSGKLSSDGILTGDLVVKGSGDPNISGRFHNDDPCAIFKEWAAKVKEAGIKEVRGDIVLDDTCFDREFVHPSWPEDQQTEWYSAEVAGLSLNDNCIDVTVSPGRETGKPAEVSVSPKTSYVTIINQCTTTDDESKHLIAYHRRPGANVIQLKGKCWVKAKPRTDNVTVHDPPLFFGTVLREVLEAEGVGILGVPKLASRPFEEQKDNLVLLGKYASSLDATLAVTNKRSQNFYAEQLLKTLGYRIGKEGSFTEGARIVREFLKEIGIRDDFSIEDGSGLSRGNRFSPRQVVRVLRHMRGHKESRIFMDSLAVSGEDGTLKKRLDDKACAGKVKAKTGSLAGVQCLSGYITRRDGKTLVFSFLCNDSKGGSTWKVRDAIDDVCRLLLTGEIDASHTGNLSE